MGISTKGLILGATAVVLSTVAVTGVSMHWSQSQAVLQENPKELIDEVWHIVNRQYVDGTFNQLDWRAIRTEYLQKTYDTPEDGYKAIREMLKKLDDPYTRFMDPKQYQDMKIDTSGELVGVGIQISKDEKTKEIVVISPIEDTPAFSAGILAKDVVLQVDDKPTEGMEINDVVQLIRGQEGTEVTLKIRRGQQELSYTLRRAKIQLHPVKYNTQQSSVGTIGYIRLTQFSAQAPEDMRKAIEDLESKKVVGYILDLRSNPGGLLTASIDIARMWIDDGKIVSTVDRVGTVDEQDANHTTLTNKPLVVLVDGGSASASEILSGALQDHQRAKLVGTKTFGKGLVQSVRELGDGSGLAVTIAKYLTPNGRDINKHGIDPDIKSELSDEQRKTLQQDITKIGTAQDPQFATGLGILMTEIRSR